MAKHKYGKHKKGKHAGKSRGKKRSGAGKAWREKVRLYGKKKAWEMTFGGKLAAKKAKHSGKGRKGKRKTKKVHHRARSNAFKMILAQVKEKDKTTGWPVTADEIRKVEQIMEVYDYTAPVPRKTVEQQAAEHVAKVRKEAAKRVVSARMAEAARKEAEEKRRRAQAAAEAEIEAEAKKL